MRRRRIWRLEIFGEFKSAGIIPDNMKDFDVVGKSALIGARSEVRDYHCQEETAGLQTLKIVSSEMALPIMKRDLPGTDFLAR